MLLHALTSVPNRKVRDVRLFPVATKLSQGLWAVSVMTVVVEDQDDEGFPWWFRLGIFLLYMGTRTLMMGLLERKESPGYAVGESRFFITQHSNTSRKRLMRFHDVFISDPGTVTKI